MSRRCFPAASSGSAGAPGDTPTLVALSDGTLRSRAACRVRQRRRTADGAWRRPPPGNCRPLRARRKPAARHSESADREACCLRPSAPAVALLLVVWLAPVMSAYGLPGLGGAHVDLQPDLTLVAYAGAVTLLTALVCGMTPALRSTKGRITADIQKGGSRTATGHLRLRHTFVVAQVAISLFLLVIASLFLRSLLRLSSIDPGFDVAHGVVVRVPAVVGCRPDSRCMVSEQIAGRLRRVVGVRVGELGDGDSAGRRFARRAIRRRRRIRARRTDVRQQRRAGIFSKRWAFRCCVVVTSNVERSPGRRAWSIVSESLRACLFSRRGSARQTVGTHQANLLRLSVS